ncbi:hypothetical protein OG586_37330 [Streptomyces murinus]|uniref:hypothetical protein n=1 Tax=Streptomyces murinus TaxID=33900 RepID=UPI002E80C619|nr:hypothetical protein [Streptomyces murinus]WUD04730.1 hypothetical protein OG586_00120 [Streptomyces murinus]WUD11497.1 hypothetical protein OG586_37330 [Streptomyces murinus]
MYDSARTALRELEDDQVFERVALHVLRARFPELRITSATGDLGRDAFGRPLFGKDDSVVLWVSLQEKWTSKLKSELVKNRRHDRRAKAIYVTNRSTIEKVKERWRKTASDDYGVALEIVTLAELATELDSDGLRWVAELELGVRPRAPYRLSTCAQYVEVLAGSVPGMTAPVVGREAELLALGTALAEEGPLSRVVVVEGPGGAGKTRLAIEAARVVSAVLVAPTGVALEAGAFAEVPIDDSLIVLIDDADRARDLSGLAALLHDVRFQRVRFVLTVRPGRRLGVLQHWGVERWAGPVVELRPLERSAIDALVTGRGIGGAAFRQSVIDLAQGNPLIAHMACEVGLAENRFDWPRAADLLRAMAERRLPADDSGQQHRAAAVALALLGPVAGAEDLAALAGAISALPPEPYRLSVLLDDLADAGLADAAPYSVRPALLAPVLVADALDPRSRVRLDAGRALDVLLNRAGLGAGRPDAVPVGEHLVFSGAGLGSQLNTLAQAAHDRPDAGAGARLASAVRGLLSGEADLEAWAVVVGLAGEVAVAAPGILTELHGLLVQRWPLAPSPQLWGEGDPAAHYRYGLQRLGERFAELAQRVSLDTVPSPVRVMLDVAWLMEPALPAEGSNRRDGILQGIQRWCSAPAHTLPGGFDALLEQRGTVLRIIAQWVRDRGAYPPHGLDPEDAAVRGPLSLIRVLLAAMQPLLHLTVESTSGSPESASTITLHAAILPDQPQTLELLCEALALLVPLLDEPVLRSGEGLTVLHTLVSLPGSLRREGARPLLSGTVMPAYAEAILDTAATEFTAQIAARWDSLPLPVRRSAAQAVLGPGSRPTTLSAAAAAGDEVAVGALADTALTRLAVLQPLHDQTPWREAQEAQHLAAQQLGGEVDLIEALELLDETAPNVTGVAVSALPAFAQAVGVSTDDPRTALERIARAPLAGEGALLAGLAQRHPDVVWPWLEERVSDPRLAAAALTCADEHPNRELRLLPLLLESAAEGSAAGDEVASRLAWILNWHLVPCKQPLAQRMKVLASLASQCPPAALPNTLQVIGFLLQEAGKDSVPVESEVAGLFAEALRRRLGHADQIPHTVHFDEETASGAVAIASSLPEQFAAVLVEQLLAVGGGYELPGAWARSLARLTPPVREQLVSAYLGQLDRARSEAEVSERTELAAARLLSALGRGTEQWAGRVRQWASGAPAQRQQAAAAIQHAWQTPLWAETVSSLLATDIDVASRDSMLAGIVLPGLDTDLPDDPESRRTALAPLVTDANAAVRAFASDALRRLDAIEDEDARQEADFKRGYRR